MPPKRNPKPKPKNPNPKKKAQTINNQKGTIASRLLEISLKVDNYIYKHIPISERNAALYLEEVNGYKDKCLGDKRSIQVIEKLDLLIKGIIKEHKELQGSNGKNRNRQNSSNIHDTGNQANINEYKPNTSNNVDNKDVENHVSWIENLKFVREISVEENIPMYYEDSFWESYTLPNGWNDKEMFQ